LAYTDFLARLGLGEIAAGLGLGALPVVGTALVQAGNVGCSAVSASLPAFFMTFNLLLLNEFPDEEADRDGGRKNLVILLGRRPAAILYLVAALCTPLAILVSVGIGFLPTIALAALVPSLVLVKPLSWALRYPAEEVDPSALGANVIWNLLTNLVLAITLAASVHDF
jgi:1,4-dihydroxy-2-naphthoate octaprenyltransferase